MLEVLAQAVVVGGLVAMIAIRAPYGQRSIAVPVAESHRGALETALLAFAWISFIVPIVWVASSLLAFAELPHEPVRLALGAVVMAASLWLFRRSHADLGTNWSITLELREGHTLVTHGVYRRVRHPMYTALLLYGVGQALALPNWIAGPSYLVAMVVLVALRLPAEERMMQRRFGPAYDAYRATTHRLVPALF